MIFLHELDHLFGEIEASDNDLSVFKLKLIKLIRAHFTKCAPNDVANVEAYVDRTIGNGAIGPERLSQFQDILTVQLALLSSRRVNDGTAIHWI